jgi:hemerythrin superfamily protein
MAGRGRLVGHQAVGLGQGKGEGPGRRPVPADGQPPREAGAPEREREGDDRTLLRTSAMLAHHEQMDEVLARVVAAVQRQEPALGYDPRRVRAQLAELRREVLAHFEAEEVFILPRLREVDRENAVILVAEHDELRAALDDVGADAAIGSLRAEQVHALAAHLKQHSEREEEVLYPWARERLGDWVWAKIARQITPPPTRTGHALSGDRLLAVAGVLELAAAERATAIVEEHALFHVELGVAAQDAELDPPVLRPRVRAVAGRQRRALALGRRAHALRRDAYVLQVLQHRLRALLAQLLVVRVAAALVGVAFHLELEIRMLLERRCGVVQRCTGGGVQLG